jgi:glycosyltransferase involved in cell wall biosynthesis
MRVVVDVTAVPAQPAGAGRYVLRLVAALTAEAEVDLALVARTDDEDRWRELAPLASVAAEAPPERPLRLLWEQTKAPRLARSLGADVWHGPHYTMPLRSRVPAVVTIHDLTMIDHPEWHERSKARFFPRMIKAASRRAAALVCVSQPTADRLHELFHPEVPVLVAPHGVDTDLFTPRDPGTDHRLLQQHGVRSPYVVFVGTVEPRKNLPALVAAAAGLPDVQLVLAGRRGWGADAVDAAIAEHDMADRVVQPGFVDDGVVTALYRQADAVVYATLAEGFGLPAVEALACGAPLVTSAGTVMQSLVGDAALLVEPTDVGALRSAIEATIAGGPEVDARRRRGPAVAAEHSWAASARRHVEAYRLASGR